MEGEKVARKKSISLKLSTTELQVLENYLFSLVSASVV